MRCVVAIAFLLSWSSLAQARVFNFKSETLSAFFSGGYGDASLLKGNAFSDSSGASTTFSTSDVVPYTQMIELGFATNIRNRVTMKVGAQIVQAKQVEVEGDDSGGTKLMDVTSDLYVFNPNVSFEFNMGGDDTSKWYTYAGVGWSTLSMDNAYVLTAAGQSTYSGASATFTEKIQSTFLSYDAGVGYETHMVDTTSFAINLGYRFMEGLDLRYKSAGENLADGDNVHAKNDRVKLNGGATNRQVNLGGAYVSIAFRFYIDLGY